MLYRYAMIPILLRHQVLCQEFFESKREGRLEALADFLDSERIEDPQQTVYALVYHGYLEIDFMKSINLDSVVSLPGPTGIWNRRRKQWLDAGSPKAHTSNCGTTSM
jgi:hypothetical protein